MPIAFDSNGGGGTLSGSVLDWTHNITDNTNGVLLVSIGNSHSGTTTVTNLNYAGTNLTKIISQSHGQGLVNELWYLLSPPTGLGTFHGTYSVSTFYNKIAVSVAYTGVDQTTPFLGSSSSLGTDTGSGSIVQSITTDNWLVGGAWEQKTPGTTVIGNERGTLTFNAMEQVIADSTGGTLRWTLPATTDIDITAVEVGVAGGAPAAVAVGYRPLLGVGI